MSLEDYVPAAEWSDAALDRERWGDLVEPALERLARARSADRLPHAVLLVGVLGVVVRPVQQVVIMHGGAAFALPVVIDRGVAGDPDQPGSDALLIAQFRQIGVSLYQALLQKVIHVVRVGHPLLQETAQLLAILISD